VFSRKFIIRSIAIIGIYVAAASYVFQNEEKFLFRHQPQETSDILNFDVPFQEMQIPINKKIKLSGLYFKHQNQKGLVLLFPSGDEASFSFIPNNDYFYQRGYSVLIPDYRGSGKSTSVYQSEVDIYSDAKQWYKMAVKLSDSSTLLVYGKAFGSGPAAYIGGEYPLDVLILESPFMEWDQQMLRKYFWWLPYTYFTQFKIPVWEFVRKSTNKTILIHATKDSEIKYDNSLKLLEYLKPGDELITLDKDTREMNTALYQQKINSLLNSIEKHK